MDNPSGSQWRIEKDGHCAVVVEVGGGLRSYGVAGVSIVDGYGEKEICPGSAGQVLAPWPNRIRDGRYLFGGESFQLPLSEPERHNAIHGLVRWLRWSLVSLVPASVVVECALPPTPGYPWALRLRTTWSVGSDGLVAAHEAHNLSDAAAPFGLGVHPYVRVPGAGASDVVLSLPARNRLLTDARQLPIGAARVDGGEYDFTSPRRIGATVLDSAYGGVGPVVSLSTVDDSNRVEVWADGAFHWWQVFTGDTLGPDRARRAVAVEPMTCPPDAFRSGRDLVVLPPGGAWAGSWGLRPHLGG